MKRNSLQRRVGLLLFTLLLVLPVLFIVTAQTTVIQPINIPTPAGASPFTYTVSGCSVSPTSGTSGTTVNFNATASCQLTITLPTPGSTSRIVFSGGASTTTVTTCATSPCSTFSPPDWLQYYSTFNLPITGGSSSQSINIYGTQTGTSATICSAVAGSSCSGWTDYGAVVYPKAGLGTSSQQVSASPFTYGLVGYWPLSEATSGTCTGSVFDLSGNGNKGACTNSPTFTTGPWAGSGALSFNAASSQFVNISYSPSLALAGAHSVFAWVYTSGSGRTVVYADAGSNEGYALFISSGNIEVDFGTGSTYYFHTFSQIVPANTWALVGYTFDGTTLTAYINGIGQSVTPGITIAAYTSSSAIGRWSQGGPSYFNGAIADVRIYNYALSSSEVTQLYQQRPPQLEYTVTSSATYNFAYYLQDSVNATFTVTAGTGYTPPSISIVSLGQQLSNLYTLSQNAYSEFWADQGSTISVTNPLPGSTFLQSWSTPNSPAIVTQPGIYDPVYDGGVCPTNQTIGNTNLGTMLMLAVLPLVIVASLIVFALMRMGQGISLVPILVVIGISVLLVIGVIIISNVTNTLGTVAGC